MLYPGQLHARPLPPVPPAGRLIEVAPRWDAVDRLVGSLDADYAAQQGLGPLAARVLRRNGRPVPEPLLREERAARAAQLVTPVILTRARRAYDGPLLVLKGPELASRYPDRARRFGDIDLLPADPEAAQAALLAAGFVPAPREEWPPPGWAYVGRAYYHLQPLELPGVPLTVEIHRQVNWPVGLEPPRNEELFAAAEPSALGIEGLLAPAARHHAVLLAAHGWAEGPVRKLRDLVDLLVFVEDSERDELRELARHWHFERGWTATLALADWLLGEGPEPRFARLWARHVRALREPTVFETHLQHWFAPFWLGTLRVGLQQAAAAVGRDLRPKPDQTWAQKGRQTVRALLHPLSPRSVHARRSTAAVQDRRDSPAVSDP